jgi:large conductance mechanosensitive channel
MILLRLPPQQEIRGITAMWKEFKEFALRGSVIDLAVGIIIGAAFNNIVQALVNHIIMPPASLLIGRVNFEHLFITLTTEQFDTLAEAQAAGVPIIRYGLFLSAVIDFLILAFFIFLMVRWINKLRRSRPEQEESNYKNCPYCTLNIPLEAVRCPECTAELQIG